MAVVFGVETSSQASCHSHCTFRIFLVILLAVSVFILYIVFLYDSHQRSWLQAAIFSVSSSSKPPVMLVWTGYFGVRPYPMPDLRELQCPVSDCMVTQNRSLVLNADSVLYHWWDVKLDDLPKKPETQKWVLWNYEPPPNINSEVIIRLADRLDWVVSYRLDSDIYSPYGGIRPRERSDPPFEDLSEEQFQNKSPIAWMASNCRSFGHRENLVREIMKHVSVDVFGKCAHDFAQKETQIPNGQKEGYGFLAQRYKFYLAFENSVCKDYVTEKAYLPLMLGMVPVVFGGADYNLLLPPRSFVNAMNFSSPKFLAEHLVEVSNNFTLYKRYMDWRMDLVVDHAEITDRFFCDVCARLHNSTHTNVPRVKKDFSLWWNIMRDCIHS